MDDKTTRIAKHLLAEHRDGKPYRTLQGPLAPADLDEAYAAQRAFIRLAQEAGRGPLAGYKVALTSAAMQAFCGVDHPLVGGIFAGTVKSSPATISLADYQRVGVEFELALKLGRAMPADDRPYDAATAAAHVEAIVPAFELVEDRNAIYENFDARSLVADNAWCAGIVLGRPLADWRRLDLAGVPVTLLYNGEEERSATGATLGNPLNALAFAANLLAGQGRPLEAGMIVMTGSTLKTRFPVAGDDFRYTVDGVGEVVLSVRP